MLKPYLRTRLGRHKIWTVFRAFWRYQDRASNLSNSWDIFCNKHLSGSTESLQFVATLFRNIKKSILANILLLNLTCINFLLRLRKDWINLTCCKIIVLIITYLFIKFSLLYGAKIFWSKIRKTKWKAVILWFLIFMINFATIKK